MDVPSLDKVQAAVGDHYAIETLAGRGGMGAVFRGRHRTLDAPVAVKVLPVPAEPGSAELTRFEREARLAANLPHPHIVPVYEFQVVGDLAFFIMPFVEGVSLAQWLEEHGRMDLAEVRELVRQVGSALGFAHQRGVIHRDVKPANLMRETATGRWLVTDFGVARAAAADRELTRSGMVIGTPAYMAPEQAAGAVDVDGRADLYALAAVVCEALTGQRTDTLRDAVENEVLLRAARPDIPRALAQALTAALAFDRNQRPESLAPWLAAVEAAFQGRRTGEVLAVIARPRSRTMWMAAAVLVASLAGAAWLLRDGGTGGTAGPPGVAVLPAAVDGPLEQLGLALGLTRAFEDQLGWLPEVRVVSGVRVDQAVRERFGPTRPAWEVLAPFLATTFDAAEVLGITAAAPDSATVRIEVQVRSAADGRTLRGASGTASLDSLPGLVSRLVTEAFAVELARARVGWNAALPAGLDAIQAWLEADRRFRSGAYDRALERYDAVIALDSTFAPAYFGRMLCELLRLRPSEATDAVRLAVDAATRYRERLDPATGELLDAYRRLVADGELEAAHDQLHGVTARRPAAVDAWFLLGYLQFYVGPLIGVRRDASRVRFERAHELSPDFAAPLAQLALLAVLADDREAAQRYFGRYLAIDSASVWAELMRMTDSLLYRGPRAALAVTGTLRDRPPAALELIALGGGMQFRRVRRQIARDASDALLDRATTAGERVAAFRLRMAGLLGEGRFSEAAASWRAGRRQRVPEPELDLWLVVLAGMDLTELADPAAQRAASARLAVATDPAAVWAAAVWQRGRDPAGRAGRALERLAAAPDATPLSRSLQADLGARGRLAAGDTAGALAGWREATRRYSVDRVPFGMAGSLWPLRLAWVRAAAAAGDMDDVLTASAPFEEPAGQLDQMAWWVVLPLRADALERSGDPLAARTLRLQLAELLADAEGPARAVGEAMRSGGNP